MAKNRTPQTFEKRQRERNKQLKREAKKAERLARNLARREDENPPEVPVIDASSMFLLPEEQEQTPPKPAEEE